MSTKEAKAIETFNKLKNRIFAGQRYENTSTPLAVILSIISSIHFRDTEALKRAAVTNFNKMNRNVLQQFMARWELGLMQYDVLRAPLPPSRLKEGTFWPIYMKDRDGSMLKETFMFVFWKRRWMDVGNMGNP